MMTDRLRRFAGLTNFASNLRVSHCCSMEPAGAFSSAIGVPTV